MFAEDLAQWTSIELAFQEIPGHPDNARRSLIHIACLARLIRYPDGAGFYLQVKAAAQSSHVSRSWLFRYNHNQHPTWMGLGSVRDINLAEARQQAAECRRLLALGKDPIAERDGERARTLVEKQRSMSFGATRGEIDAETRIWSIPGARMKAGRDHRVPLSDAAWKLLPDPLPKDATALLLPAPRGGQLSDMASTAVMQRMEVNAVPHGFLSTFRDWCSESTDFPREVAQMALAHAIGDKVEAAHRRGDLFDKRRQLMSQWAAHCGIGRRPPAPGTRANHA